MTERLEAANFDFCRSRAHNTLSLQILPMDNEANVEISSPPGPPSSRTRAKTKIASAASFIVAGMKTFSPSFGRRSPSSSGSSASSRGGRDQTFDERRESETNSTRQNPPEDSTSPGVAAAVFPLPTPSPATHGAAVGLGSPPPSTPLSGTNLSNVFPTSAPAQGVGSGSDLTEVNLSPLSLSSFGAGSMEETLQLMSEGEDLDVKPAARADVANQVGGNAGGGEAGGAHAGGVDVFHFGVDGNDVPGSGTGGGDGGEGGDRGQGGDRQAVGVGERDGDRLQEPHEEVVGERNGEGVGERNAEGDGERNAEGVEELIADDKANAGGGEGSERALWVRVILTLFPLLPPLCGLAGTALEFARRVFRGSKCVFCVCCLRSGVACSFSPMLSCAAGLATVENPGIIQPNATAMERAKRCVLAAPAVVKKTIAFVFKVVFVQAAILLVILGCVDYMILSWDFFWCWMRPEHFVCLKLRFFRSNELLDVQV
jgi:hypothetical protein